MEEVTKVKDLIEQKVMSIIGTEQYSGDPLIYYSCTTTLSTSSNIELGWFIGVSSPFSTMMHQRTSF